MDAKEIESIRPELIENWLVEYLSELLELEGSEIARDESLASYGLDSSGAVGLIGDLGTWLGRELSPTLLYSYPSIDALTRHLSESETAK